MHSLSRLVKKKPLKTLLDQAQTEWPNTWQLLDPDGILLAGHPKISTNKTHPIQAENGPIGTLKADFPEATFFSEAITSTIHQEIEKKLLGAETLQLYREINLMFRFSEKLLDTRSIQAIARLTLEEARHIIPFENAALYLWHETTGKLRDVANSGPSGGEILPHAFVEEQVKNSPSGILDFPGQAPGKILFVSLRIGKKIMGGIVLTGPTFAASDLQWLSTLAFQAAVAIESTLLQEKETAKALHEQKEKLILELALKHPFYKKVADFVRKSYTDPDFSVAVLADQLHLSTSQLQRKTAAISGLTPLDLIRNMRLHHAQNLLTTTDLTISEIAFQSGFNDPSYFTRLFSKELGMAPKEWKRNNAAET